MINANVELDNRTLLIEGVMVQIRNGGASNYSQGNFTNETTNITYNKTANIKDNYKDIGTNYGNTRK